MVCSQKLTTGLSMKGWRPEGGREGVQWVVWLSVQLNPDTIAGEMGAFNKSAQTDGRRPGRGQVSFEGPCA